MYGRQHHTNPNKHAARSRLTKGVPYNHYTKNTPYQIRWNVTQDKPTSVSVRSSSRPHSDSTPS